MTKTVRSRYTLEFKQEAVRLVRFQRGAYTGGGGSVTLPSSLRPWLEV